MNNNVNSEFWMRAISFSALHKILLLFRKYPEYIRACRLNQDIISNKLLTVKGGIDPSNTTLYHYLNTLLRLGLLVKVDKKIHLNHKNPYLLTSI